jgi:hypothetical protein
MHVSVSYITNVIIFIIYLGTVYSEMCLRKAVLYSRPRSCLRHDKLWYLGRYCSLAD